VTWATGTISTEGPDPDRWLRVGVEIVDDVDPVWLTKRLFHYDAVVLGNQPDARLAATIEGTQPQARWISLSALDGPADALLSRAVPLLADAGIAPPRAKATAAQ
jgi:hypothetical protein